MSKALTVRLLGPLNITHSGVPVDIGHSRQRGIAAVLLLNANRVVSVSSLIEKAWGPAAPPAVRTTLYSYITRLRSSLADSTLSSAKPPIRRVSGGYVFETDDDAVDERRVRALIAAARACSEPESAASLYGQARRLWSGIPLEDVESPWLASIRRELEDLRIAALLDEQAILTRIGRPSDRLIELGQASAERPLDEAVARALMRALKSAGRRADALKCFEVLRVTLREELGTGPDADTARLHQELLHSMTASGVRPRVRSDAAAPLPIPAQLPCNISSFVGRSTIFERITALFDSTDRDTGDSPTNRSDSLPRRTVVDPPRVLLHGMAGVGKTALGLRVGHHLRRRFPGGQIYIDMSGNRVGYPPLLPGFALKRCLRSLGLGAEEVPGDDDEAAALFRSLLHGKRVLLFLDDAAGFDQVQPLLPGDALTGVLITSRRRMPQISQYGVTSLEIGILSAPESLSLIGRVAGTERVAAEPTAAARMAELCGHLPLALRLLAERAADRPLALLRELAAQHEHEGALSDSPFGATSPLDMAFQMSYAALATEQRAILCGLAKSSVSDFTAETAAVVVALPPHDARLALEHLRSCHLIEEYRPGRFRLHILIRQYGRRWGAGKI